MQNLYWTRVGILLVWCLPLLLPAQQTPPAPPQAQDDGKLPPVQTSVTVVGELQAETPANVSVLGAPQLAAIPGVNLDDRMRMVPGFTLFRRTSSLVANPTTQGVSLRGIGSSGASRTLVLWDGVPVNDPFGGWVYWTRLAPELTDRVEILRSASTSVFGDRAMGGAIALFSPPAEQSRYTLAYEGGNLAQSMLSGGFTQPFKNMSISAFLRGYTTSGYYIVPGTVRGRSDTKAGVDFVSPFVRFDYMGDKHRLYFKGDILVEDRDNGTVLQRNSTQLGTISAHYSTGVVNNLNLIAYHTRQEYHQSFSTILADRNSERLTSRQTVPSEGTGAAGLFRRGVGSTNFLVGADVVRVEGYSLESLIPTGFRSGGGTQLQHGVFGQVNQKVGIAQLQFGLRHHFAGQGSRFLSPSGGITVGKRSIRGRASAYRSFRAPTLNELYREFRAGNAVTQANAALLPETITGVEAGADWVGETRRLGFTSYYNSVDQIITNVTLVNTPAQIIRQRRNAANAKSRGMELDFRQRWRWLTWESSYMFVESRYATRERIPHIPKHQGSGQVTFAKGGTLFAAGMRSFGLAFEDDRNTRSMLLPGFAVFQMTGRQRIAYGMSATVALENAFDRTFLVGWTPTPNIGAPRMWRIGLRWDGH